MANPTWPASLPDPRVDGSTIYAPAIANVITSSMETGAPKRRRRFTSVPESLTANLILTGAQCGTLDTFVVDTLQDTGHFDWQDWRSGAACHYVFTERPTYTAVAGSADLWQVQIKLMQVAA